MTDIDPKVASLLSHMANIGSHSKMVIYPDQARALLAEVAELTEERDQLQKTMIEDFWKSEAVKHERDQLAAVIETVSAEVTDALGKQMHRVIDRVILALRKAPPAVLAARDAEKKAEALDEANVHLLAEAARSATHQRESDVANGLPVIGTSTANEADWYQMGNWAASALARSARTPQQGDPT